MIRSDLIQYRKCEYWIEQLDKRSWRESHQQFLHWIEDEATRGNDHSHIVQFVIDNVERIATIECGWLLTACVRALHMFMDDAERAKLLPTVIETLVSANAVSTDEATHRLRGLDLK